jgi:hypothetical protein
MVDPVRSAKNEKADAYWQNYRIRQQLVARDPLAHDPQLKQAPVACLRRMDVGKPLPGEKPICGPVERRCGVLHAWLGLLNQTYCIVKQLKP